MTEAATNLVLIEGFLPKYKIGDTVRLKSGGPLMTVTAVRNNYVEAQWFEGRVIKQKILPFGAVNPAKPRSKVHV